MATAAGSFRNSKSRPQSGHQAAESPLAKGVADTADLVCNGCLWAIVLVVPMMMAGIREFGVALFVAGSLLMAAAWAARQLVCPEGQSAFSWAAVLGFAAITLVSLQLVSLPQWLVHRLSPFSSDFFPAWQADQTLLSGPGYWSKISLTPSLTRSGLVLLIAYVTFFLTLLQRLRTIDDIDAVLRLIAIATIVMAGVGLGQLFFGNGQFLWIIKHPFRSASWPAKGTFTNQNHFAHFLALGIGPLVWWWKKLSPIQGNTIQGRVRNSGFGVSRSTTSHQQAVGAAIAVVVLAGVLSFSRGGITSIIVASVLAMAALGKQWKMIFHLGIPVISFMAAGVLLFGTEVLESKWNRLAEAESLQDISRGRFLLWSSLLTAAHSFWPAGSGVGSHAEVYPTWMKEDFGKRFSHAESGYLQVLIETGLPGLVLVLAAISLCAWWGWRCWKVSDGDDRMRTVVILSGLLVSVLHSFVDFVWYIPACLIFALILAACLCRIQQLGSDQTRHSHGESQNPAWPGCWAAMIVLMILPVGRLSAEVVLRDAESETVWMSYREQSVAVGRRNTYESPEEIDIRLDVMIDHLEECVRVDPGDFRAMSDLATLYVRRFERGQPDADNPMSVREIRSTVESTEFESSKEILNWLKKAFGNNVVDLYRALAMARKAVHGQPLRAENYLVLAQLGFLQQLSPADRAELVDQAVILRPHKAPVLYSAGLTALEKGNLPLAFEQWKKAFHIDPDIRPAVIRMLVPYLTPEEIIDSLRPGPEGLWLMIQEYTSRDMREQQKFAVDWYVENLQSLSAHADGGGTQFWVRSHDIFRSAGKPKKAVVCLSQAVKKSPSDYALRKQYAFALIEVQASGPAVKELQWCQLRKPDDLQVTQALKTAEETSRQEVPDESM